MAIKTKKKKRLILSYKTLANTTKPKSILSVGVIKLNQFGSKLLYLKLLKKLKRTPL